MIVASVGSMLRTTIINANQQMAVPVSITFRYLFRVTYNQSWSIKDYWIFTLERIKLIAAPACRQAGICTRIFYNLIVPKLGMVDKGINRRGISRFRGSRRTCIVGNPRTAPMRCVEVLPCPWQGSVANQSARCSQISRKSQNLHCQPGVALKSDFLISSMRDKRSCFSFSMSFSVPTNETGLLSSKYQ